MKTRVTELFEIKHPVILAGMTWVSVPSLVAAVSNAGGLGILGAGAYTGEQLREAIRETRSLTDKPFGVNITLISPAAGERIPVVIEEKVPIVNYSLGKATEIIRAVHEYGGKVIGTVALLRHALRAEQGGADALIVTGYEAAAHAGNVGALVLIPTIASRVKIPTIGAGGFCDGKGLAAALALGADGISMGTGFTLTKECAAHENVKRALLEATEEDTLFSDRFDGMLNRVLKTRATEAMMKRRLPIIEAVTSIFQMKRLLRVSFWELLRGGLKTKQAEGISLPNLPRVTTGVLRLLRAISDGDLDNGYIDAGQVTGRITDIPSCSELIERIVAEAEEVLETARGKAHS